MRGYTEQHLRKRTISFASFTSFGFPLVSWTDEDVLTFEGLDASPGHAEKRIGVCEGCGEVW